MTVATLAPPRVTAVLAAAGLGPDFSHVPPAVLEHAARRGTALHLAIQWHHEGALDEETLHHEVQPGFLAYKKFVAETQHRPIASEIELLHPAWGYVGHPDRIGWLGPRRVLIDFKYMETLHRRPVVYQLGAYVELWNAVHPTEPVAGALAVQFRPRTGGYVVHDLTNDLPDGRQVFLAALVVYRARQQAGGCE